MLSGFEDFRASLKAHQRDALSHGRNVEDRVFGFSHEIFSHTNDYREVFRAMVSKQSSLSVS